MQSFGQLSVKFLRVSNLRLPSSIANKLQTETKKQSNLGRDIQQHFQVSFYADYIEGNEYSQELSIPYSDSEECTKELCWDETQIPQMYTPINDIEILKTRRLIIILWYLDEFVN